MNGRPATLSKLGLTHNPFPPAATGVAFMDDISLHSAWAPPIAQDLSQLSSALGEKSLIIVGGYGSGKTYILRWIAKQILPQHRIEPFFFENPGVSFYDLANRLLRQIGRYELAKSLWELFYKAPTPTGAVVQNSLLQLDFPQWLATLKDRHARAAAVHRLSTSMRASDAEIDEEIANKLARIIVETHERPFYEYRDFIPKGPRSLVAEHEEPNYFRTLIRILLTILQTHGIAFLIDEFRRCLPGTPAQSTSDLRVSCNDAPPS